MKNWKKIVSIVGAITGVSLFATSIGLVAWKESDKNSGFILANYQSYIDIVGGDTYDSVEKHLTKEYGVSYDYFETAESAKNLLVKKTADIVNSTTYELVNWVKDERKIVQKLDWSRFGIPGINSADDALGLFIEPIHKVLKAYDIDGDGTNDNLLDYGIPYFLQDYIFAYRGDKIQEFEDPTITWKKFFELITTNDNIKKRFEAKENPEIFAVEDSRSFFSIANNIHKGGPDVVVSEHKEFSNQYILDRYNELAKKFNKISKRSIAFNGDANVIVNKLATGDVKGGFCYNGDALYAAYGGDDNPDGPTDADFHVVKPVDSIAALDMFVISSGLSEQKLNTAYDVMGELCLGIYKDDTGKKVTPMDANWDCESSWSYRNFDFVNYTTPIKKVYDYVEANYFDNELQKKIFIVNTPNGANNFEKPISDISKSNMAYQWYAFKSKIQY